MSSLGRKSSARFVAPLYHVTIVSRPGNPAGTLFLPKPRASASSSSSAAASASSYRTCAPRPAPPSSSFSASSAAAALRHSSRSALPKPNPIFRFLLLLLPVLRRVLTGHSESPRPTPTLHFGEGDPGLTLSHLLIAELRGEIAAPEREPLKSSSSVGGPP